MPEVQVPPARGPVPFSISMVVEKSSRNEFFVCVCVCVVEEKMTTINFIQQMNSDDATVEKKLTIERDAEIALIKSQVQQFNTIYNKLMSVRAQTCAPNDPNIVTNVTHKSH